MSREGISFNPEDAGLETTGDEPYPPEVTPELEPPVEQQHPVAVEREQPKPWEEEALKDGWGPLYEKKGFWGKTKHDLKHTMRRGPIGERITIASIVGLVGWVGASEVQKVHEYVRMGQREKQLQVELGDLERLNGKKDHIRELFGTYPRFHVPEDDVIEAKQNLLAAERKKHTFLPIVTDPSDQSNYEYAKDRVRQLEQSEPEKEYEPTEIKTDIVAQNYRGREVRISQEQLRTFATRTFPRGWVSNEVVSIEQSDARDPLPERYGIKDSESAASCERGSDRDTIVFHGASKDENIGWVLRDCLPHELGHANDWESDAEMSGEERMNLLLAIGERLGSKDRYQSSYVERINNPDEQYERYQKATEYWAEICAQYFRNPEAMDVKDFMLVDDRVRKVDPGYDVDECRDERQQMVLEILFPDHAR